jgi:flagellar motor switch protein FliM
MGEKFGRDPIWEGHLATEVFSSDVELDALLFDREMSLNDVMKLDVGQTLLLDTGPEDPVKVRCGDVHLTEGLMGQHEGNISVQVTSKLTKPKMTLAAFEKAVEGGSGKGE